MIESKSETSENVLATVAACDGPLVGIFMLMWFCNPPAWYWLAIMVACGIAVGWVYRFIRDECAQESEIDEHAKFGGQRD